MARRDIKICGLKTLDAVDAVIAGGATHAGFIFFDKSPRNVDPATAATLTARAQAAGLKAVAVTVDADEKTLDHIVELMRPDVLQLHGRETRDRVAEVKARYGLETWKALSVSEVEDLEKLEPYRGIADRFLLDAKPPKGSELPGGNAVSFDWSILKHLPAGTDYLLAGGLDAKNVADAVRIANPPGLDISSGVESAPGVKDEGMIAEFLNVARLL